MFNFFRKRNTNNTIDYYKRCLKESTLGYDILKEEYNDLFEKYQKLCKNDDTFKEMYTTLYGKLTSLDLQLKIIQVNLNPPMDDNGNILPFHDNKGYLDLINQMIELVRDQITDLLGTTKKGDEEESEEEKTL